MDSVSDTFVTKKCSKCKEFKPLDMFYKGSGKFKKSSWCKRCTAGYSRKWEESHREERREKASQYNEDNKKEISARRSARCQKLRLTCIDHYSNHTNVCECCGEFRIQFLCLDHVDGKGSGARQRAELRKDSADFYSWLIANNFPTALRVLCHNCNLSLGLYGFCPHSIGITA